jgi:hypothetical protein
MIARLSDLDYTRLYGRYRTCHSCGRDYDPDGDCCPVCKHSVSTLTDRSGRLPAMLTLAYPGDWLTVAPTAETVAEHYAALCKRYARAWGEELIGPWKKEFQRRGAPHLHISTTPPMGFTTITDPDTGQRREVDFKTWLSITWADIVAHPDLEQRRHHQAAGTGVDYAEGIKLTDPRRMAVYFAKYGTADGIRAGRILRRWYRAKGLTKRARCQRVDQATGRVTTAPQPSGRSCSVTTGASSPSTTPPPWHPSSLVTSLAERNERTRWPRAQRDHLASGLLPAVAPPAPAPAPSWSRGRPRCRVARSQADATGTAVATSSEDAQEPVFPRPLWGGRHRPGFRPSGDGGLPGAAGSCRGRPGQQQGRQHGAEHQVHGQLEGLVGGLEEGRELGDDPGEHLEVDQVEEPAVDQTGPQDQSARPAP